MRSITGIQDNIFMSAVRNPILKVYLYDQTDDFSDIVLNTATQIPLDLTRNIVDLNLTEAEDSASTLDCSIVLSERDFENELSPYIFLGKKVIKVCYTDSRLKDRGINNLINLFIGPILGQPGFKKSRDGNYTLSFKAEDRSNYYKKRSLNTIKFLEGVDLGEMAVEIATNTDYGFGLQRDECKFGLFFSDIAHTEVSLFDVAMLEGMQLIGFIVDKKPGFDGDGFFRFYDTSLTKVPARVYTDYSLFTEISWIENDLDPKNRIVVVGLANVMTKVISEFQKLATINGTIGYFQEKYKKRFTFSDDGQGRAENVIITEKTLDGQVGKVLGGSSAELDEVTEFGARLIVKCPYQTWVFIAFFGTYVLFFILALVLSIIPILGQTASGKLYFIAAVWLTGGLMIMQQIGTFEVVISGNPYKIVYEEIKGIAEWSNLKEYEKNEEIIENHFVYTQEMADSLALRELERETTKVLTRQFMIPFDPALEVHDIIELPDESRFYITGLSKSFKREEVEMMTISAFMIRSGKEYNNENGYPVI